MLHSTFVLKEAKSNKKTFIFLIVRFNYERVKYSTGEKILPEVWTKYYNSDSKQLICTKKKLPKELISINNQLKRYSDKIESINDYFTFQKIVPTTEFIREELNKEFKRNYKAALMKQYSFIEFAEDYKKTTNKKQGTLLAYAGTIKHLKDYQKISKKILRFENIDFDFYDKFIQHLKSLNYSNNTIGNQIKNVKVFMRNAEDKNLHNNTQYKNSRFKVMKESADNIYLTDKELQKIYELDLLEQPHLERTRDIFIVGAWTGLRISDLKQLSPNNIIKTDIGKLIKIKTIKTGEVVIIPLHPTVTAILKKYKNEVPRVISNQLMNEYLRDIGKTAKINEAVIVSKTAGGIRKDKTFEKWQLITSHTARRSFATNMYLADIPSISIMKITGHKTESSFLTYIKISQEDNAKKLLKHPLFAKAAKLKAVLKK